MWTTPPRSPSRYRAALAGAALLGAFLAAPLAADEKYCDSEAQVCLREMAVKLRGRGWVGIQLHRGPQGMTVAKVWPKSPAERAGLQKGDALVAFEGVPYDEERRYDLEKAYQRMKPGHTVTYLVRRGERQFELSVQLVALPEEMVAQWIGQHYLEAHLPPAHAQTATHEPPEDGDKP